MIKRTKQTEKHLNQAIASIALEAMEIDRRRMKEELTALTLIRNSNELPLEDILGILDQDLVVAQGVIRDGT